MSDRRVVITGMGILSPVGNDIKTFWENLTAGRSGIDHYKAFDSEKYTCTIAGEVKNFDPAEVFKNSLKLRNPQADQAAQNARVKEVRRTDRYTQFAIDASRMALEDAGLGSFISYKTSNPDCPTEKDKEIQRERERFGVIIGSGIGGLTSMEKETKVLYDRGPSRVSPFTIAMMISNMASGMTSMEFGLLGPNYSIVTACATSNNSIGEAWRIIKFGDADVFLAGGAEATITPLGISGFSAMKALSTRNDEPARASRPFDLGRDGFVMGEGAGVFVLEELEHAKRRGARIYCELIGYGLSSDAYHMTQPLAEGAARCMKMAMEHAKVNPDQIDYINAHATSTPIGDVSETTAIKMALGECAKKTPVSSTKSMTGHLLGAAGGIELAACVLALRDGIIPPTINLEDPDPKCDLDYVPNKSREKKLNVVLSNSFGFGGHNATLIIRKFEG